MILPHAIDRTLLIRAPRATVFSFFTDSARFASWWGAGSSIDARPGGAVRIRYPDGSIASGSVQLLEPGQRIVFTYGYEGAGKPIAPGSTRVTIRLHDEPRGTRLEFRHEFADAAVRDQHVQGWRYHLSVFATVAAAAAFGQVDATVEHWFAAWNEPDEARRRARLQACCRDDVTFRDSWSALAGIDDLVPHIGGAQQFMPGLVLARTGPLRQCQGTVLADWQMRAGDRLVAAGTNVFELTPDGRIEAAVGVATP